MRKEINQIQSLGKINLRNYFLIFTYIFVNIFNFTLKLLFYKNILFAKNKKKQKKKKKKQHILTYLFNPLTLFD